MADVLPPPTVASGTPSPTVFPNQTWATTPSAQMLAPPLGASPLMAAPQPTQPAQGSNTEREKQLQTQIGQAANPAPPEMEATPPMPKPQASDPFGGITPIMMILGGLAAGRTLTPATTMLNSFADYNKNHIAGDADRAKAAYEAWKEAAQQVRDSNKERLATYREVLESNKGDKRAQEAELTALISEDKLYAAMHKDDGSSLYTNVNNWVDTTQKATDRLSQHLDHVNKPLTDGQYDDRVLVGLKPEAEATVKALVANQIPVSALGRTKDRAKLIGLAEEYSRGQWNAAQYDLNKSREMALRKGPDHMAIEAVNRAINHAGTLYTAAHQLGNTQFQKINEIKNNWNAQVGDPAVESYRTAAIALADELAKAFSGGGTGAEAEKERWLSRLGDVKSPEQFDAVLSTAVNLLRGQMSAIADTNRELEEGSLKPDDLVLGDAKFAWSKLKGLGPLASDVKKQEAQEGGAKLTGLNKLPPGFTEMPDGSVRGPDGTIYDKKGP